MGITELYDSIVDDVVENLREAFSEEGVDERLLETLKESWLRRIGDSQRSRQPPANNNQASVIVFNNNSSPASAALNLSQQHRQQIVAEASVPQLDGSNGTSDEDENEDDNEDESEGDFPDVEVTDDEDDKETERDDEDPLNSGDDVSNDETSEMFETENVVVCQYDKITRNRNKWKFHLKDGIMNIDGKDYVFQKAVGDAEW